MAAVTKEPLTVRTRLRPSKPVTSPKRPKGSNPVTSAPKIQVSTPTDDDQDSDYDADESRVGRKSRPSPRTPTDAAAMRKSKGNSNKDTKARSPTLFVGEGSNFPPITNPKPRDTTVSSEDHSFESFLDFNSSVSSNARPVDLRIKLQALPVDSAPLGGHTVSPMDGDTTPNGNLGLSSPFSNSHAGEVPNITSLVIKLTSRPIFEGTYSTVYKGEYGKKQVAIKVIRSVKHEDHSMNRKLRREVDTWWQLKHPKILPLYGYIETEDYGVFGAMISPWCDRGTATDYLATEVTQAQRVELFRDVAEGIQYLHTFKPTIVHGDLKPGNVLIDDQCVGKLCDFGLVRIIHDQMSTGMTTTSAHTGTARYLAYELLGSEEDPKPTTASDVHALGCVGMEFLYSKPPYAHIQTNNHRAHFKICQAISKGDPPATRPDDADEVISELWDVLESCWNPEPEDRPEAEVVSEYLHRKGDKITRALM